jgi:hypothetical protein
VYVNYADNSQLDALGFTVIGTLDSESMKVVDRVYAGYGQTPDQDSIYAEGDAYLLANFPLLTFINGTTTTTATTAADADADAGAGVVA